jgi:hypothetical protein
MPGLPGQDMSIVKGCAIEDMGHKMGCNGVDNGKLWCVLPCDMHVCDVLCPSHYLMSFLARHAYSLSCPPHPSRFPVSLCCHLWHIHVHRSPSTCAFSLVDCLSVVSTVFRVLCNLHRVLRWLLPSLWLPDGVGRAFWCSRVVNLLSGCSL